MKAPAPGESRRYKRQSMIKLYSPDTESELAVLKSLFDAEGIHYFVLNDHFGTLRVGPKWCLKRWFWDGSSQAIDGIVKIRKIKGFIASTFCRVGSTLDY